ncbi:hypothetical protein BGZ73_009216 [Actinomortierella ambigua]|nr:hypothetical protein BGZ73_009216 [Actinomortierella ambigua]
MNSFVSPQQQAVAVNEGSPTAAKSNKSYILGPIIGTGAYSSVHLVTCERQVLAGKTFSRQDEFKDTALLDEISFLERLRHRNIIQFVGVKQIEGRFFLLMDLAEGGCLSDAILSRKLFWPDKQRIAHEIARGVECLHSYSIVHRDLKSANVLLTDKMEAKLCDFGLSKIRSVASPQSSTALQGTIRWMAPEVLSDNPEYSTKSDMYSFGMIMWEMAADCTVPFQRQHDDAIVKLLVGRGSREKLPEVTPPQYRAFVEQCWNQDPQERPEAHRVVLEKDQIINCVDEMDQLNATEDSNQPMGGKSPAAAERSSPHGRSSTSPLSPNNTLGHAVGVSSNHSGTTLNTTTVTTGTRLTESTLVGEHGIDHHMAEATRLKEEDTNSGVSKNDGMVFFHYLSAADKGCVKAYVPLAKMYLQGLGIPQNLEQAAEWFRKAGEQGDMEAQFALADMYYFGRGVELDYSEASTWYRKAAENGHANSQINLAAMYQRGMGVELSDTLAEEWFKKAADQGDHVALFQLGLIYEEGKPGVPKDHQRAINMYRQAAELGHAKAEARKANLEKLPKRKGIIRKMFK